MARRNRLWLWMALAFLYGGAMTVNLTGERTGFANIRLAIEVFGLAWFCLMIFINRKNSRNEP